MHFFKETFINNLKFLSTTGSIKGSLSGLKKTLTTESPQKVMKNTFYFILKALFVLEIFIVLSLIFVLVENELIRRLRLISKFMTLQTGQKIITVHILPNISWKTCNHAMKFSQLIKSDMQNIFFFFQKFIQKTKQRN